MRKIYYVDLEMCGPDLPADFSLEEFCEELQGKVTGVEVVPVLGPGKRAFNRDHNLIPQAVFLEALGEYCPR